MAIERDRAGMTFQIGLIGCGRITDIHPKNCARFDGIDIVACDRPQPLPERVTESAN